MKVRYTKAQFSVAGAGVWDLGFRVLGFRQGSRRYGFQGFRVWGTGAYNLNGNEKLLRDFFLRLQESYILLGGSRVVISTVISRVTILLTHIRGHITPIITTHEPPSSIAMDVRVLQFRDSGLGMFRV